jgi:hypothetical protein
LTTSKKTPNKSFAIYAKVEAYVAFEVAATTLEDALTIARGLDERHVLDDGVITDRIDGSLSVTGIHEA